MIADSDRVDFGTRGMMLKLDRRARDCSAGEKRTDLPAVKGQPAAATLHAEINLSKVFIVSSSHEVLGGLKFRECHK